MRLTANPDVCIDLNDVVVRANYRLELNGSGRVVRLLITFGPTALGGRFDNDR